MVELLQKLPKNLVLLSYIVDTQHHNEVSIVCLVLVYYKVLDVEWFTEKGNWGLVRTVTESRLIYKRQRQLLLFRLLPMLCKQLLMSRPHITHSLVKKVIIFRTPNLRRADEILRLGSLLQEVFRLPISFQANFSSEKSCKIYVFGILEYPHRPVKSSLVFTKATR